LTTGDAPDCGGATVTGAEDLDDARVRGEAVALAGLVVAGVSSDVGEASDGVGVLDVGVVVEVAAVGVAFVALAASSLSATWGAVRTFVDAPSLKTATACHTTKLVTTVARTHDAAVTPAMRRRDPLSTPRL
jgi:hypothetical protein